MRGKRPGQSSPGGFSASGIRPVFRHLSPLPLRFNSSETKYWYGYGSSKKMGDLFYQHPCCDPDRRSAFQFDNCDLRINRSRAVPLEFPSVCTVLLCNPLHHPESFPGGFFRILPRLSRKPAFFFYSRDPNRVSYPRAMTEAPRSGANPLRLLAVSRGIGR